MKANRLICAFLFLAVGVAAAQQPVSSSSTNATLEEKKVKAEKGDAKAQIQLGFYYIQIENKPVEAMKWVRKAAEQGNADAQFLVGLFYDGAYGMPVDYVEAIKWHRKAAEQGLAKAQSCLGRHLRAGQGGTTNLVEAVQWFRKAVEQNLAEAQFYLGVCYANGEGVAKDEAEALKWYRKAAEQNHAEGQFSMGFRYDNGEGVAKDEVEAVKWYRKAAEQNFAPAQVTLGYKYANGQGVVKDEEEAVKWYRKAAEQNLAGAQYFLGGSYAFGNGVAKDYVEAYKWMLLASAQGFEAAKKFTATLEEDMMTREQIAEGQKLARNFKPRSKASSSGDFSLPENPSASGSGFFITDNGYLVTNEHVVRDAAQVRLVTSAGLISAKVVKVDAANDLALLKAEGKFSPLPVAASRGVKLGGTVATVGFPNIGLQGFAPKLAKGEIASLSGARDDARYFQISVPVQPGNSGGALVDKRGNVVGVVSAKLSAAAALKTSGALPENVNYAVEPRKLSGLGFLESVPDVAAKLKEANTKERKFDDVVKDAEKAAVLVLVY